MSPYEISRRLQVEERAEFRRVLGLDNSSHRQAGKVSIALDILNTPDATDGDFRTASVVLLMCLFGAYYGVVLDQRQRCLWVLGMSNEPSTYTRSSVDIVRSVNTRGCIWTIKTRTTRKTSTHRPDIRQPHARQCLLDIVHPLDLPTRHPPRRHMQTLPPARVNNRPLQAPAVPIAKDNDSPMLEDTAENNPLPKVAEDTTKLQKFPMAPPPPPVPRRNLRSLAPPPSTRVVEEQVSPVKKKPKKFKLIPMDFPDLPNR